MSIKTSHWSTTLKTKRNFASLFQKKKSNNPNRGKTASSGVTNVTSPPGSSSSTRAEIEEGKIPKTEFQKMVENLQSEEKLEELLTFVEANKPSDGPLTRYTYLSQNPDTALATRVTRVIK